MNFRKGSLAAARALVVGTAFLCLLGGCQTESLPDYPPAYREYAYVTDGGSNEVSVIDLLNFHLVKDILVGESPTGIATNPKKNEVYVVNTGSGTLSVIDAERNRVVSTIALGRRPYFVALTPGADLALVANSGSDNVSVVDLDARRVIQTVTVGRGPGLVRISRDGSRAVVSNRDDGTVSVLDISGGRAQVHSTLKVCKTPEDIAILADSNKVFVSCGAANQVAVVELPKNASGMLPSSVPAGVMVEPKPAIPAKLLALLDVGKTPVNIALKPDGGELFVSNFGSDSVSEVLTGSNEVSSTHLLGSQPARALVSPDDSQLYVSDFGGNAVTVYNINLGMLQQVISVGSRPDALAFTPNAQYLLAVDSGSGDVAVIRRDSAANLLFTMVPVGREPRQIAVKNFMLRKPPE